MPQRFGRLAVGLQALSGAKVAGAADTNGLVDTGINSGTQRKDCDLADDALRRRLEIARDRKDLLGQIYRLNNVGTVLLRRGAIAEAKKTFDRALEIARRVRSLDGMGLSLSNLGWVAAGLGDCEAAIKSCEVFRRQAADPTGEANTLNNLGEAYHATGNYPEASLNCGMALQLAKQSFDFRNQFLCD